MPTVTKHQFKLDKGKSQSHPLFTTSDRANIIEHQTLDVVNDLLVSLSGLEVEKMAMLEFIRLHNLEKDFQEYFKWENIE